MIKVALTANLQKYFPESRFEIEATTVQELLQLMDKRRAGFSNYILEDTGAIRKHVNIFIDGEVVQDKSHSKIPIKSGSQIHIMQALSGG